MKLQAVTIVVAGVIVSATPASGAPQWVEDACWYHANRVLPALTAGERGSLYRQLHRRLYRRVAAGPAADGPQEIPRQILIAGCGARPPSFNKVVLAAIQAVDGRDKPGHDE